LHDALPISPFAADVSVNHIARSGPSAIDAGPPFDGSANSVSWPLVVMRPILPTSPSVNHSAPSAPTAMPPRADPPARNSLNWPAVVMRPSQPVSDAPSVNHSAPSGPAVMPN